MPDCVVRNAALLSGRMAGVKCKFSTCIYLADLRTIPEQRVDPQLAQAFARTPSTRKSKTLMFTAVNVIPTNVTFASEDWYAAWTKLARDTQAQYAQESDS